MAVALAERAEQIMIDLRNTFKPQVVSNVDLRNCDALVAYKDWESPTIIVSDGPYGILGYEGDMRNANQLPLWYETHIAEWSKKATPQTTLWFWNTELGWANVHPILEKYGWEYKCCHIWDKGKSHVAGNVNTKTLKRLPVVTEVCVQYVFKPVFKINNEKMTMQEWLIHEWKRTKLPFRKTNEACGVVDAATRKYFTKCHLWYMPPVEMFQKIVDYANTYGDAKGKPYFSETGITPLTAEDWAKKRAKFNCEFGLTNVWSLSQLTGEERLKNGSKALHLNQKPLKLVEQIIRMSSDKGDIIWDPFSGLCTVGVAAMRLDRKCYASEINTEIYNEAQKRLFFSR
jgi:site-specific DNA-methyltransferase (adenine-specific)